MITLESRVAEYTAAVDAAALRLLTSEAEYAGLYEMLRYHLGWSAEGPSPTPERGKRLRPTLCLLAAQAVGADWRVALPAATAVELIHNFSLIHDDIEDASPVRHHRRTIWSIWGTPHGINAGDALLIVAQQALTHTEPALPDAVALGVHRLLLSACRELCEGQYLDLLWERTPSVTVDQYLAMIERKTARLFQCAAEIGAYCAGGSDEAQRRLGAFGRALGMTFQVADDLSGIWSAEAETGKTPASDVANRKKTLPILLGLAKTSSAAARLRELFGLDRVLTPEETLEAIDLLQQLGAREEAQAHLLQYRQEAFRCLEQVESRAARSDLWAFAETALPDV